jgi:hypothetical protein
MILFEEAVVGKSLFVDTRKVTGSNILRHRRSPEWACLWFALEYYLRVTQDHLLSSLYKPSIYDWIWVISAGKILSSVWPVFSACIFDVTTSYISLYVVAVQKNVTSHAYSVPLPKMAALRYMEIVTITK